MNQSNLTKWLKFITFAVGIMGFIVFLFLLPVIGKDIVTANPEFAYCFWPWLVFIWILAISCYIVLIKFWGICSQIELDNSFSAVNVKALTTISKLAIFDCILCFLGNVIFFVLNMSHPGIMLGFLFIIFAGIAIAIVSAALAHLVEKASKMKEENDLTI